MRNKRLRHKIKMRKFKKRLRVYELDRMPREFPANTNAFRTTSCPCNCWMCKGESYKRTQKHKKVMTDFLDELKQTA